MALKVVNANPGKITSVGNNYGFQYAPNIVQQPKPTVQYVQHATPPRPTQGSKPALQGGRATAVQPVATAAQIAQAARVAAEAVAREVARQKEIKRQETQGKLNTRTAHNSSALKLSVANAKATGKIRIGSAYSPSKLKINWDNGEDDEYNRIKAEAAKQAMKLVNSQNSSSIWGMLGDKLSGNAVSQSHRRKFAENEANAFADRQIKSYESKLDNHNRLMADRQAAFERSKLSMGADELNALADSYNIEIQASFKNLKNIEAYTLGTLEAYGMKAEQKLTGKAAGVAGFINRNVISKVADNPVWKYTLGEGSQNIPSIVTAPSRLVNLAGNLNTKDRNIYKYGGETANRTKNPTHPNLPSMENAWQSTFNQRNFNIRPVTDAAYDRSTAWRELSSANTRTINSTVYWQKFKNAKNDDEKDKIARKYWEERNRSNRNKNSAQELAADPLSAIPFAKGAKTLKAFDKVRDVKNVMKSKLNENKVISWLGAEHKGVNARKQDFIDEELDDIWTKKPQVRKIVNYWQENKNNIKAAEKSRIMRDVVEDLGSLKGNQIKAFQKYFDTRDWSFKGADKLDDTQKTFISNLAKKYQKRYDQLYDLENRASIPTPYRKNYLPQYPGKWNVAVKKIKGKLGMGNNDWWFTKPRTKDKLQKKKQLTGSMSAREYHSAVARKDIPYLRDIVAGSEDLGRNIERIENADKFVKQTKWEKAMQVAGAPGRLWKKSVLLGNPAWYANNELFNQISGFTEGGFKFLKNQRGTKKYFEHIQKNAKARMRPSEARKMIKGIGSTVSKEVGTSRLARVATGQENRARISLYRTMRQRGMTHDEAIKRVDRALFNYTTKNWERPLKTVVPFWQWQKNLTKRAATMPFTNPKSAIAYNRLDRHQQNQFTKDFDTMIPELKELGYTDREISDLRSEQKPYYKGKLKVGDRYMNTPYNAFSEKGLTSMGFNPYIAAAGESAEAVDYFGKKTKGNEASIKRRLTTKFPQAELARQGFRSWRVNQGIDKPSIKYIGKSGSEGYGLTKEKQGYNPSKSNYVENLDPRKKLGQNVLAFLGVPRTTKFDKDKFVNNKKLEKVTAEYFSKSASWKDMDYEKSQAEQEAFFKKYNMTPDEFYKGQLAKYDSDHAKKVKGLKEDAAKKNKSLFDEYGKQPYGTKSIWASEKLEQLVSEGYFNDNPFLKSFKWINKDSFTKANKQKAVKHALATGDWSAYRKLVGTSAKALAYQKAKSSGDWSAYRKQFGTTPKAAARDKAVATGDWTEYKKQFGTAKTAFEHDGKYFKSKESMESYKEGTFWRRYALASKEDRRKLLSENPAYNKRANWTEAQWDAWKIEDKKKKLAALKGHKTGGKSFTNYLLLNEEKALRFTSAQTSKRKYKKIAYA